jgi:SRSO17 transposase
MLTGEDFAQVESALRLFLQRFADCFGGYHRDTKAYQYITALLTQRAERRNAENLAETLAEATARAWQSFLSTMAWPIAPLIARLQQVLAELLQAKDGVWVLDGCETPKEGTHSVGVKRQWCGRLGKIANCQAGVFLAYTSSRGAALTDGRLYLPEDWLTPERRAEVQIPAKLTFRTKIVLALDMLQAALRRGVLTAAWVVADETYGRSATFRQGVAALGLWYVGEIDSDTKVRGETVAALRQRLTRADWACVEVADGAQGPRRWLLYVQRVQESSTVYRTVRWLIVRQNLDGSEPRYYFSNAPAATSRRQFGVVITQRSRVEQLFEDHKGECGLDEYEVRSWPGWYHHMLLCLLAHAFLVTQTQAWQKKGGQGLLCCRCAG